jgi:hypothetical protein
MSTEEPEGGDLGDDGTNCQPPLFEEKQIVASELGRCDPIEARACMLAKRVNDLYVAADGRSGVVATYELVVQALQ